MLRRLSAIAVLLLLAAPAVQASLVPPPPVTQTHLLSGSAPTDGITWDFAPGSFATTPAQVMDADWQTIRVPSNWELEGFGTYSYGRGDDRESDRKAQLSDVGTYRHVFSVPEHFRVNSDSPTPQRRFFLRFQGVMTDARVFLNGRHLLTSEGDTEHRGGFVPFSFEVTDVVNLEGTNELIVAVREESSNRSINKAERDADYWLFGGIYRPVELISQPARFIESVAIDAQSNGRVRVEAIVSGEPPLARSTPTGGSQATIHALIRNTRNPRAVRTVGEASAELDSAGQAVLSMQIDQPRPWSADRPNRYTLELRLGNEHRHVERFGFRTVEVRTASRTQLNRDQDSAGLFVNDERVVLRGINRHSFWPSAGRSLTAAQNRRDVELIKELGFNAVRSSHYPPDQSFLDACDELGLYVIDELPGWHDPYDTQAAKRIAAAMVRRDRNHPSILLWANGNEGGWNPSAETVIRNLDLQRRPIIRPDSIHGDFDTRHYPTWRELETLLDSNSRRYRVTNPFEPPPLIMPTEMLHGLYDGGGAAGLDRYWHKLSDSPRFAGGFLWALLDEGVVRVDQAKGRTASGELQFPIDTAGNYAPDGIVGPFREPSAHSRGVRQVFDDLRSSDVSHHEGAVGSRSRDRDPLSSRAAEPQQGPKAGAHVADRTITLTVPGTTSRPEVVVEVERGVGGIVRLLTSGQSVALTGGRWLSSTEPEDRRTLVGERLVEAGKTLLDVRHAPWPSDQQDNSPAVVSYTQTFEQPQSAIRWTLSWQGLRVEARGFATASDNWAGLQFEVPRSRFSTFEWTGTGPDRIWRNRQTGTLDRWRVHFDTDDSDLGSAESVTSGHRFDGLELAGVYKVTAGGLLGLHATPDQPASELLIDADNIGMFAPSFPLDAVQSGVDLPDGLTFYARIPAIGTKFYSALELEPPLPAGVISTAVIFAMPPLPVTDALDQ